MPLATLIRVALHFCTVMLCKITVIYAGATVYPVCLLDPTYSGRGRVGGTPSNLWYYFFTNIRVRSAGHWNKKPTVDGLKNPTSPELRVV